PFFADLHSKIAQPRQLLGEGGQLVIVGSEESERAKLRCLVEILEDRLSDTDPVVGAGATTHLVEDQQAAWRGMGQDVCRLHHFNHEGRQPARQLIVGADPGEDDRKSTRLNSSHGSSSYAVFCLKKQSTKLRT